MTTATRYAIVGSGNIGSALARLFARAGVEVAIANTRGPESLREVAAALGPAVQPVALAEALDCDVIFMAVPFPAVEEFGRSRPDWTGKIVVDTTNAYFTPNADEILRGRLSSHYTAEQLPGAEVVKAFNQLPANILAAELDPAVGRRVIFVASDVPAVGDRIADLIGKLGLAAVQLGRIGEGGRLIQARNALVLRNFIEQPMG
ncbi:NADPH-dependent F420 reductase [Actinoplanes palleronii]|uniref:NADP oxidoreductase n=1 Tax=Actinoplanes palleronii TaxID=113570 RepID=A0ABQ4BHX3_9ACTN|nr:NAD(P)-binding domain-containing protein [Actinoplanes palleronii]GIE70258.1 NADP oxidoreductase [Actinoplanes palleronii]